jgi:hypothetical protein
MPVAAGEQLGPYKIIALIVRAAWERFIARTIAASAAMWLSTFMPPKDRWLQIINDVLDAFQRSMPLSSPKDSMATEAQIAANRNNAQASTGPTSAVGRSRSSRNALSSGLFSRGDFVLPDEQAQYAEFCASFQTNLEPEGGIEQTLSAEIIHAASRMRRCSAVLTGSLDPMVDPAAAQTQQAVDRARNDAHRAFQRSISELRRLQTERQFRTEPSPRIST